MKHLTSLLVLGLASVLLIVGLHQSPSTQVEANIIDTLFRNNCCYYVTIKNCSGNGDVSHLCPDCTKPTPYCGAGRCNVFGCNCDACRPQKEGTEIVGTATWLTENF